MKSRLLLPLLCCILVASTITAQPKEGFVLQGPIPLYTNTAQDDPLYKAIKALQRDIEKITGTAPLIKSLDAVDKPGIIIINAQQSPALKNSDGWEAHHVYTDNIKNNPCVVLEGADRRGTIYAVYTFCEKILGVPPLWYYCNWQPIPTKNIVIPAGLDLRVPPPTVKYRAWFPNDTDLFAPWRKTSPVNNEIWLETALRLKMNTIEWFETGGVSPTTLLIHQYGLINTTHHHSPLNASFSGWKKYWEQVRDTVVPELSLANETKIVEFWRYNIEAVKKAGVDMIWVIGFRGAGDHPFWYTFKDAPESMKERGEIISHMLKRQRDLVIEVMGNTPQQFRTIFYDELSDLLAEGYIQPPADDQLIWNFVAARRDHYPNTDLQKMPDGTNKNLGYYFNYQFTSTGSHLAAGEGPWKMEQNYRYVAQKSNKPLLFSVVNAGNLREFVMELAANAAMMWNTKEYTSTKFVNDFCKQYYGPQQAKAIANLYKDYYNAFWQQKKPDLKEIDRQYIFQDLRYKRAILEIVKAIQKNEYNKEPLTDHEGEQFPGRTYRIVPEDNNESTVLGALAKGTTTSGAAFEKVAKAADEISKSANKIRHPPSANQQIQNSSFLTLNLATPAWFMYNLNKALYNITQAYQSQKESQNKTPNENKIKTQQFLNQAIQALQQAEQKLQATQTGPFKQWYNNDKIFGLHQLKSAISDQQISK